MAETEHRRNERITAQTPPRLVHGCRGGRAARRLLAPAAARGLPAPPAAIATEQRAEYLAKVWARLVAGHDREVACERELEQAEFDAIDDEGRRHRVSLGNPPHQLGAVAAFLKLAARRGNTDFSAETISAAMTGSGYSVELSAALLAELKAAGHYDDILAEAAAAGPAE